MVDAKKILNEYEKGKEYNSQIGLYENVEKNERFYIGNHWEGVETPPGIIKPVFNFIKRVVSYFIAMLVSDDIGINLDPFDDDANATIVAKIISKEIEKILEKTKFRAKLRTNIRNCCVDGDTCVHATWDPTIDTKETYEGDISCEIIENTNILYGNPYSDDLQSQPYILIVQRLYVDLVKEQAKSKYKLDDSEIEKIASDSENQIGTDDNLTTVITKYFKKEGKVFYCKTCGEVVLQDETTTERTLYPISYMNWETVKNSYHGQSPITGMIPNQIFINKIFAMAMVYITNNGFPKVLYDSAKIKKISNDVSESYKVSNLDIMGKIIDGAKAPDFSAQVPQIAEMVISYTRDCMGANDAALGNVKADNTSAIIALQNASAVPLELQKLAYYDFIEDFVRVVIEMMAEHYGVRKVRVSKDDYMKLYQKEAQELENLGITKEQLPESYIIDFDFSKLKNLNFQLNIDIGSSNYWSEVMQINTLDNLMAKGILSDAEVYLEMIPDKYVKNKEKIIQSIKEKKAQMEAMNLQQTQGDIPAQPM
ncbi:MAG: hypothetical protein ACK5L6_03915 [Anaerorhabdus sp.]|uniref:hypothetical protein n=1 Tax=Anaerorhabdus sp. TaxID=1872524 RepID=UPI003A854CDF